jgi:outer membrane receptor for ferrienterochelin and colicin
VGLPGERERHLDRLHSRHCFCGGRLSRLVALTAFVSIASAQAQEATAERIVVQADRLPSAEAAAPFAVEVVDAEALRRAPQLRLDDILRAQVPGFSLFRRSSSRTANPTTQGVTLRNFGPSGAGRTLVLLDGIPLNDPFAGYVLWSQVPPASLESVLVQPGGGAGLFGNAALAGTIFLVPRRIESTTASGEFRSATMRRTRLRSRQRWIERRSRSASLRKVFRPAARP